MAAGGPGQFVVVWSQAYYTYETGSVSRAFARRVGQKAAPCSPAPLSGCRETTVAGSGVLTFKTSSNPARNRLTWRFARGPEATLPDFGDPFTTDSYTVCLYDASAARSRCCKAAAGERRLRDHSLLASAQRRAPWTTSTRRERLRGGHH